MKLPRVLFILKIPPPFTGATMMNKHISESTFIKNSFKSSYICVSYRDKIDRKIKFPLKKIVLFIDVYSKLLFNLIFKNLDLIYLQFSPLNSPFYRDALLALTAKLFKIKILFHVRVYGIKQNSEKSKFNKWLYKTIFRNNYIACHSKNMFFDFNGVYDGVPLIIQNGIEDRFKNLNLDAKANSTPEVLFISNFLKSKGIEDLLSACKILAEKNINFRLTMIGDYTHDYSENELRNIISGKKLTKYVKLAGPKYGEDKDRYLMQCDLFVFPTLYEAFGNVVIEAMQAAKPIIATNEGSLPLMIDHERTGFIVEKNNPVALTDKIEYLIKNKELRIKMGEAGRKKYETNYTLEKFEQNFIKSLNQIISL